MFNVVVSTDGACAGNHKPGPAPGGYAAILRFGNQKKEIAGFEPKTTNNRMEMRACVEAVATLKKPCNVTIRTDSHVLIGSITVVNEGPTENGWVTKTGARRANCDLIQKLYDLKQSGGHVLYYQYVKAHNGDEDNERCDFLAKEQIRLNV